MTDDIGIKECWEAQERAYFEYHCLRSHDSEDAQAWYRDRQQVTVLGVVDSEGTDLLKQGVDQAERLSEGCPVVYRVRFEDGHEHDVFEDELLVDPSFFDDTLDQPRMCVIPDSPDLSCDAGMEP